MKTSEFTRSEIETAFATEMSKLAKEPVTARLYEDGDLFLFGSEIACLRLAHVNRSYETKVEYSKNLKTFYIAIYKRYNYHCLAN